MPLSSLIRCRGVDGEALLSFRSQGLFTDVKFLVNGKKFDAHKVVLASRSDVFQAMFTSGLAESKNDVTINISDIDEDAFAAFIEYLYSRDETLVKARPVDMLMCADKYNVRSLLLDCDNYFISTIGADTIYDYIDIAETFRRKKIKANILQYFKDHLLFMLFQHESWAKLQYRFDTLTEIIGSYSHITAYHEFAMKRSQWEGRRNPVTGTILKDRLYLYAGDRKYSFTLEINQSTKQTHVIGILDIVEKDINTVRMDVWVEIEWEGEFVMRDKMCISWSKICTCNTGHLDVECWRFDEDSMPKMSSGPVIFAVPNKNIYDKILTVKIGMRSLSPQPRSGANTIKNGTIDGRPLTEVDKATLIGFGDGFRLRKNFDLMWSELEEPLTVDNAASTLCRILDAPTDQRDRVKTEIMRYKIFQFIKFHTGEVIKSKDWAVLASRDELLQDLLVEIDE